jgi:hypothetical protein
MSKFNLFFGFVLLCMGAALLARANDAWVFANIFQIVWGAGLLTAEFSKGWRQ